MLKVRAERIGRIAILHVHGNVVVGAEVEALRKAVLAESDSSAVLLLDFARVSRIDAAGLGALLRLRQATHASGRDLRLMNMSSLVRRVFEITRLDSVFQLNREEDDVSSAVMLHSAIVAAD